MHADTNSATNHPQRQRGRDPPVQYVAVFAPHPSDWGATCADTRKRVEQRHRRTDGQLRESRWPNFHFPAKFSRNLGSMLKMSTLVLWTSRKYTTGSSWKALGRVAGAQSLYSCSDDCGRVGEDKSTVHNRCWTPTRLCAVTTPVHTIWIAYISGFQPGGRAPRIDRRVNEGVSIGSCMIHRMLFANGLVLLASSEQGLQNALDRFSAAWDQAGMKIRAKKTEVLCHQKQRAVNAAGKGRGKYTAAGGEVQVLWGGIHEWRKTEQGNWYTGW